MKRDTERIADDLKDIPTIQFHRILQYDMMPRPRAFPCFRMFACKPGRTFNVGEQEGDGASWITCAHIVLFLQFLQSVQKLACKTRQLLQLGLVQTQPRYEEETFRLSFDLRPNLFARQCNLNL